KNRGTRLQHRPTVRHSRHYRSSPCSSRLPRVLRQLPATYHSYSTLPVQGFFNRLVAVKNRYDPTNLFRLNANVEPSV
ncbi:MAG: BBE domain-containing protein, partial [Gemmatimonadetes bacterium]|nr:BBE domain-containing protein [Gemmatimonadota bacterium]